MVTQEFQKEKTDKTSELDEISSLIEKQKTFFQSGETLNLKFRLNQLKKLYVAIKANEKDIYNSIQQDFKKSMFEIYGTEIALVLDEIKYFLKSLPKLMRPERVKTRSREFS